MKAIIAHAGLALALSACGAAAAGFEDCTEIISLPAVITQQGVHCFKKDLTTSITSGAAITVNVSNVVIEMNGFKLGGLGGGLSTSASGILAVDRQNITVRNGAIRGFHYGVLFDTFGVSSSRGHLIEQMRIEGSRKTGIYVRGYNLIVRNNLVFDTGGGTDTSAAGITVELGAGHLVADNVVSGVEESSSANGILVLYSTGAIVRGNQVRNVVGGSQSNGIRAFGGAKTLLQDNVVINSTTGGTGIYAADETDACIDNIASNFTTAFAVCSLDNGNRTY